MNILVEHSNRSSQVELLFDAPFVLTFFVGGRIEVVFGTTKIVISYLPSYYLLITLYHYI